MFRDIFCIIDSKKAIYEGINGKNKSYEEKFIAEWIYNVLWTEDFSLNLNEIRNILCGINLKNKDENDVVKVKNIQNCVSYVFSLIKEGQAFNEQNIKKAHEIIYKDLEDKIGGVYRTENSVLDQAAISIVEGKNVQKQMQDIFKWYELKKEIHPIEKAVYLYIFFLKISPFIKGNYIMARILLNYELVKSGYVAVDLNNKERLKIYYALSVDDVPCIINIICDKILKRLDVMML